MKKHLPLLVIFGMIGLLPDVCVAASNKPTLSVSTSSSNYSLRDNLILTFTLTAPTSASIPIVVSTVADACVVALKKDGKRVKPSPWRTAFVNFDSAYAQEQGLAILHPGQNVTFQMTFSSISKDSSRGVSIEVIKRSKGGAHRSREYVIGAPGEYTLQLCYQYLGPDVQDVFAYRRTIKSNVVNFRVDE